MKSKPDLKGQNLVIAGGTGNVGFFLTKSLLEHGARVAVPSRSKEKLHTLKRLLDERLDASALQRFVPLVGDISDDAEGTRLLNKIENSMGVPDGVIASLGRMQMAPALLETDPQALQTVLNDYLFAHFNVARRFLPGLKTRGGRYVSVNGPLAFEPWDGTGLVSIATAAQQMLFQSLVKELKDTPAVLFELMNYVFIRNHETQPSNAITGDDVGTFAAHLFSGQADARRGETFHVKSQESLEEIQQMMPA